MRRRTLEEELESILDIDEWEFEYLKARLPSVLPESFSDIIWDRDEMQKAKAYFDDAKRKRQTLSLPKDYAFYDDSL